MLTRLLFAENIWDAEKQRARAHLVYNCGRADNMASTQRLRWPAKSILRRCAPEEIVAERRLAAAECLDWSGRRIRPSLRARQLGGESVTSIERKKLGKR